MTKKRKILKTWCTRLGDVKKTDLSSAPFTGFFGSSYGLLNVSQPFSPLTDTLAIAACKYAKYINIYQHQ